MAGLGCVSSLCDGAVAAWLGCDPARVSTMRVLLSLGGPAAVAPHGMKTYRQSHAPANATSDELRQQLWAYVQLYTRTDPEQQLMRCTHHDAATLPKLFAKIVKDLFGGKPPVCRATFRKIVQENLDAEGLHLLGIAVDHNKCHICKLYEMLLLVLDRQLKHAKQTALVGEVTETVEKIELELEVPTHTRTRTHTPLSRLALPPHLPPGAHEGGTYGGKRMQLYGGRR